MGLSTNTRLERVQQRIKNQRKKLDKVDACQGYTTIPWPVVEEEDDEYMQRITDMNLRIAIPPLAKILVKNELEGEEAC